MLVLTRRTGESIVIGNDIVVTVLEVRHDQVRIGIDAPRSVQVHREEVFAQVMEENTAAVASAADLANPLLRRPVAPPPAGSGSAPRKGPRLQPPAPPRSPARPAPRVERPQATPLAPPAPAGDASAPGDAPGAEHAG
jgi:carbon storage regulator